MSFLDLLKKKCESVVGDMEKVLAEGSKKDKEIKATKIGKAVAYGSALIAAVDGDVDDSEKKKFAGFVKLRPELKNLNHISIIKEFNAAVELLMFDKDTAKEDVKAALQAVNNIPGMATLILKICCAIGAADGDFDDDEKAEVIWMAEECFGVSPSVVHL